MGTQWAGGTQAWMTKGLILVHDHSRAFHDGPRPHVVVYTKRKNFFETDGFKPKFQRRQRASIDFKAITDENLEAALTTLDHVYGVIIFDILLSKKSDLGTDSLNRFGDGSYDAFVNNLQSDVLIGIQ